MPIRIDEVTSTDAVTTLAIGDSGSGKSIAMCSYPGPVLNINLDDRIRPIVEYYRGSRTDIYFERPSNFSELDDIVDGLENTCPYKTVILDPVTNLSQLLLDYSTKLTGKDKGKKKGTIEVATIEDYNVETKGMSDIIHNLKLAGKIHNTNIVFIAHLLTVTHQKPGGAISHTTQSILTAGKKIAAYIPTQFDEVYYFFTETIDGKPRYKVRTFNDGQVAARTSFLSMPGEFDWTDNLNFYGGISKFFGGGKKNEN